MSGRRGRRPKSTLPTFQIHHSPKKGKRSDTTSRAVAALNRTRPRPNESSLQLHYEVSLESGSSKRSHRHIPVNQDSSSAPATEPLPSSSGPGAPNSEASDFDPSVYHITTQDEEDVRKRRRKKAPRKRRVSYIPPKGIKISVLILPSI